jgi:hypothetical protein
VFCVIRTGVSISVRVGKLGPFGGEWQLIEF